MNILAPAGSISPAARDYVTFTGVSTGVNEQQMVLATTHGRLATLSHGDISLAIASDFRKETGEFTPDALLASGDTTSAAGPHTEGSFRVFEAMAELQIVAARDRTGLERLEIDLAARRFRFDSDGSATDTGTAWNARALIRPFRGLTLRATTALAFRTPSISELFRGNAETFPGAVDPCDNVRRATAALTSVEEECRRQGVPPGTVFGTFQQRTIQHGNPDLAAETARVTTSGAVLEPARGLALSVDFWRFDVNDTIRQPTINLIFTNCYQRGIREFCDLVHRDPALNFAISFVDAPTLNLGTTSTTGIDAAIDLTHNTPGLGQLRARAAARRLIKFDVDDSSAVAHGLGNYDLGVHPELKANLTTSWQHPGGLAAGVNVTFVGAFLECQNNNCNGGAPSRDVPAWHKVDAFTSLTTRSMKVTVGVNNVFDRPPPTIYIGFFGDSDGATYDYLGRFFYTRISQQF